MSKTGFQRLLEIVVTATDPHRSPLSTDERLRLLAESRVPHHRGDLFSPREPSEPLPPEGGARGLSLPTSED